VYFPLYLLNCVLLLALIHVYFDSCLCGEFFLLIHSPIHLTSQSRNSRSLVHSFTHPYVVVVYLLIFSLTLSLAFVRICLVICLLCMWFASGIQSLALWRSGDPVLWCSGALVLWRSGAWLRMDPLIPSLFDHSACIVEHSACRFYLIFACHILADLFV